MGSIALSLVLRLKFLILLFPGRANCTTARYSQSAYRSPERKCRVEKGNAGLVFRSFLWQIILSQGSSKTFMKSGLEASCCYFWQSLEMVIYVVKFQTWTSYMTFQNQIVKSPCFQKREDKTNFPISAKSFYHRALQPISPSHV